MKKLSGARFFLLFEFFIPELPKKFALKHRHG